MRCSLAGVASFVLVAGLGLTVAAPASAQEDEPLGGANVEQQVWDELGDDGITTVWVYLAETADLSPASEMSDWELRGQFVLDELTSTAESSQADLLELLNSTDVEYQSFWIANTVRVDAADADLVQELAARPEVAQVTADRAYELPEPIPAAEQPGVNAVEWGIDRINAPDVWSDFGARGDGIVVATIDTGALYTHPALVDKYRGNLGGGTFDHNYNWHDPSSVCGSPSLEPCDNNGHGTHVMGTIVGDDGAGNQIGVAPEATFIAAKGCESSSCSQSALLSSGQFITAPTDLNNQNPDPSRRPHVVNNSWGGGANTDPWYQPTVQAWIAAGIFPQFASGNPGSSCGQAGNPGNLPESYSAGAFDINDNIASFSGRGPSAWGSDIIKPNLSAPGVAIRSSWNNGSYNTISGTSMASPHVAGVVALMWSAATALERDIEATRTLLDGTAVDTEDLQCGGTAEDNNVWGEGKLDAYAAVDQSPRGPTGLLEGTVTDAESGDPIGGASVTITGAVERDRTTEADGTYSIALPVGDYTVTASAFGYEAGSINVSIVEDQTSNGDIALQPVDSVTVSGHVTDGSGHGWAMYAKVAVAGTTLQTYTDPLTGAYSVNLPQNDSYELVFTPEYPGYSDHSEMVDVTDADVTLDVALEVSFADCREAPGYELDQPAIAMVTTDPGDQFEDYFASRGITVDFFTASQITSITGYDVVLWGYNFSSVSESNFLQFLANTDAEGAGVMFLDHAFTSWNGIKTLSAHTGQPVSVTTSTSGFGQQNLYEVTQAHPILDGFAVGDQFIHEPDESSAWLAWFDGYEGEGRQVIATAGRTGDGILGQGIAIDERANNRHVLMSIHSSSATRGPSEWSAESDGVFWNALRWVSPADATFECLPLDGGLVLGNVTDLNTGDGINGATVARGDDPEVSTTTFATPDDPGLDDGFYWLFSSTGSHDFTASAAQYVADTQAVDVVAHSANEANFSLAAGLLVVEPGAVEAEVAMGDTADRTFTITNEGTAPAQVQLSESGGEFEILGMDPPSRGSGAALPSSGAMSVPAETTALPAGGGEGLAMNPSAESGAVASPSLPPTLASEMTITHSQSQDIVAGNSVACSPDGGFSTTENGYLRVFNLNDFGLGGGFSVTSVSFGVEALDPAQTLTINLYTLDGEFLYQNMTLIGSADASIDSTDLDLVTVPVAGIAPAGSTLVVEIDAPDMSGSGRFFVGSNDAGQTAPSYLRSASCGIPEPTDTADLGFPGMHVVMNVTGTAGGGDVPWMELAPLALTLAPGESATVTVSMDGSVDQPGTYTAAAAIGHDTPYEVEPVDVTMVVTPPRDWAKVSGTVTGTDCSGSTGPLSGAIVQIDGKKSSVTLSTDADGGYAYWMPSKNSPATLIVAANGYIPQTTDIQFRAGQEIVQDFHLQGFC